MYAFIDCDDILWCGDRVDHLEPHREFGSIICIRREVCWRALTYDGRLINLDYNFEVELDGLDDVVDFAFAANLFCALYSDRTVRWWNYRFGRPRYTFNPVEMDFQHTVSHLIEVVNCIILITIDGSVYRLRYNFFDPKFDVKLIHGGSRRFLSAPALPAKKFIEQDWSCALLLENGDLYFNGHLKYLTRKYTLSLEGMIFPLIDCDQAIASNILDFVFYSNDEAGFSGLIVLRDDGIVLLFGISLKSNALGCTGQQGKMAQHTYNFCEIPIYETIIAIIAERRLSLLTVSGTILRLNDDHDRFITIDNVAEAKSLVDLKAGFGNSPIIKGARH